MDSTPAAGQTWVIDKTNKPGDGKKGNNIMFEDKEKAAGVLPAPNAAIQKQSQCSVGAHFYSVNDAAIARMRGGCHEL